MKNKNSRSTLSGESLPLFLCWLAYTCAYLGRYSYNSNITSVISSFGVSHADAGLVTTCYFFAYGIGQIVNGLLCSRYNKKLVIPISLFTSAVANIVLFLSQNFAVFKFVWTLNGLAQSILWSSLIHLLSQRMSTEGIKRSSVVMATTVPVGTVIIYAFSAAMSHIGNYKVTFLFGAVSMLAAAAIWILAYNKAFTIKNDCEEEAVGNVTEIKGIAKEALPTVAILCAFAVCNNLVKDGLTTWVPSILKERFGLHDSLSILLTLLLPMLGLLGAAGNAALEKNESSFIKMCGIWYFGACICIVGVLIFVNSSLWPIVLISFSLVSLFMHAVNNVITSMAPLYFRSLANSGLLAGLLNACCYMGSTISSYGLGSIADIFGWNGVFTLLLIVSCLPTIASAIIGGRLEKNLSRSDR